MELGPPRKEQRHLPYQQVEHGDAAHLKGKQRALLSGHMEELLASGVDWHWDQKNVSERAQLEQTLEESSNLQAEETDTKNC